MSRSDDVNTAVAKPNENGTDCLEILAQTIGPSWALYQVFLPLFPIAALVLYLQGIEKIGSASAHILGKGVILIFSTLLLLGVFRIIRQARLFSQKLARDINLPYQWEDRILVLAFIFLLFYGINVSTVYYCQLVQKVEQAQLILKLKMWSIWGIIGGVAAIFFAWAGISRTIRALLE